MSLKSKLENGTFDVIVDGGMEIWSNCDNVIVYHLDISSGREAYYEYDENLNNIYYESSSGRKLWTIFDDSNKGIYSIDQDGLEDWLSPIDNDLY